MRAVTWHGKRDVRVDEVPHDQERLGSSWRSTVPRRGRAGAVAT